jgi:predicted O-linked N-acetylglucosamine transferase (SPINDLY family)
VPHADHRARIALADIALDTSPCNGGTTTLDALASGVPVVTCPTPGFAGRMAASALKACGLGDLVQRDLDSYRALAIRLAKDRALLEASRERVRAARNNSALFDTQARVREIESAFIAMHKRALRGEPPLSFSVTAS